MKPDGAKGTSKFMDIGGLVHFFLVSVSSKSISADNCVSFIPAIRFIFHTIAFSDALYFALPLRHISCTPAVFKGVGTRTSIFWPRSDGLKFDFRTTFTSILVRPTSRTRGITRKGSDISFVVRYLQIKFRWIFFMNFRWFKTENQKTLSMFVSIETEIYMLTWKYF